jgi:fumarate reductase flavoprotein subunit
VYSAPNQLVRQKSLTVNNKGKRFFNESEYRGYYFSYQAAQTIAQPGHESATLFDANCIKRKDIIEKFNPWICEYPCNWFDDDFEKYLAQGVIKKADTVEELARKLGYPESELVATVKRYNELCKNGYDEDFFKQKQYLHPIKTPPFYAVKQIGGSCFNTWGGLVVDEGFRVLDDKHDPIHGLYAAGENVAGGASIAFVLPGGRLAARAILNEINGKGEKKNA